MPMQADSWKLQRKEDGKYLGENKDGDFFLSEGNRIIIYTNRERAEEVHRILSAEKGTPWEGTWEMKPVHFIWTDADVEAAGE